MNDIEILEWVCINKLYVDTHNECDYHNIHTAIKNLIQRNKNLEQIEKEHKEENGRMRDKIKELEKEIIYWKEQAEGYEGLAEQIKEDFENRDRWE